MNSDTSSAARAAPGAPRSAVYVLWGLVVLAGGYSLWRSSQTDEEAGAAPASATTSTENREPAARADGADGGDERDPIELRPTIDGQRVSIAPEGAEVITHIPLPDFELTNQFGETVTLDDLKGRQWVASFVFSNCRGVCPNLMKELHDMRLALGETDVRFVSITVDPERDTPQQLRDWGDIFGANNDDWWMLTGDKQEIYNLILNGFEVAAEEVYGPERLPGFEFAHTAGLVHVDAEGRMLGKYESTKPEELILLRQVLTGSIETPEDHLVRRVIIPDESPQTEGGNPPRTSGDPATGDREDDGEGE
jgi:cytochrome oxidase Cu insertion factor (SCO1/SenC/PrrC family)